MSECQSCGMRIETGVFCTYCTDEHGKLQPFAERFERMVQWALQHDPLLDRQSAEAQTRQYMRGMPAWRDHPELKH
ncbi:hypothetical protein [Leeia aquatica]|uniref:Zinc ribbon domain-containing protein n=1 Tax=Leeia aquatica TaxID=2725557 RepID=A0A847S231_9NEIS|nr:hypothetical protein [Leeia aquatica]NLR73784.1 hypothetical protein [Leeia aquatica]